MRIQPVTDEIAESLGMTSAKGALIAGVIKGGPVDNGVIQPGDVVIKFDGKDIKEMRDLPRIVAESPVGKAVDVRDRPQGRRADGEGHARPARGWREAGRKRRRQSRTKVKDSGPVATANGSGYDRWRAQ